MDLYGNLLPYPPRPEPAEPMSDEEAESSLQSDMEYLDFSSTDAAECGEEEGRAHDEAEDAEDEQESPKDDMEIDEQESKVEAPTSELALVLWTPQAASSAPSAAASSASASAAATAGGAPASSGGASLDEAIARSPFLLALAGWLPGVPPPPGGPFVVEETSGEVDPSLEVGEEAHGDEEARAGVRSHPGRFAESPDDARRH
jgi:hypothetical protein